MAEPASKLQNQDELASLKHELLAAIAAAKDAASLDDVRVTALGKKGRITEQMKTLGALAPDVRKERGAALNILKDEIAAQIDAKHKTLGRRRDAIAPRERTH